VDQSAAPGVCYFTDAITGQQDYNTNGVVWQDPVGGSTVAERSTITLGVCH